jgi:hypothetical protein
MSIITNFVDETNQNNIIFQVYTIFYSRQFRGKKKQYHPEIDLFSVYDCVIQFMKIGTAKKSHFQMGYLHEILRWYFYCKITRSGPIANAITQINKQSAHYFTNLFWKI